MLSVAEGESWYFFTLTGFSCVLVESQWFTAFLSLVDIGFGITGNPHILFYVVFFFNFFCE